MAIADIVVGGGGIIGLSVALELARHGLRVRVIERGRPMAEASWAAAGMLAAEDPDNPLELAQLSVRSRDLYPEYLERVERLSGRPVPVRTRSTLQATRPGGSFRCNPTRTRSFLAAADAQQLIGAIEPGDRSFLWLEESSLDPRDLCAALPQAVRVAGVVLEEKTEIRTVTSRSGAVEIATSAGSVSAGAFVNCCGAWADSVGFEAPVPSSATPTETVEPRKGQMLTVRTEGQPQLRHVLRAPKVYLVPRGDGRIVVGATLERAGFDRRIDQAALQRLIALAAELWPPIESAAIVESWAGLRPGTGDGLPFLCPADLPNCWLATGHFRNGILLAPVTAVVVRQMIEGEPPDVALDAFSLHRPGHC